MIDSMGYKTCNPPAYLRITPFDIEHSAEERERLRLLQPQGVCISHWETFKARHKYDTKQIVEYVLEGHSTEEARKKFGINPSHAGELCRNAGARWNRSVHRWIRQEDVMDEAI